MKHYVIACCLVSMTGFFAGCGSAEQKKPQATLAPLLQEYYDARMALFPLEATANGDNRYNDQLPIDISEAYRDEVRKFYQDYLSKLKATDRNGLSQEDQISYDVLRWDLETGLEGFDFPDHLVPINQFWSLPLTFAQLGSGKGNQPFQTVTDYENFLSRAKGFSAWCDTAIANMNRGIAADITLQKILAVKVAKQMADVLVTDVNQSVFYMPVNAFPESFSATDKSRLDSLYTAAIQNEINPAYQKLRDYFNQEYIPHCRTTVGLSEVPGGAARYAWLAKYWTTTTFTPDSIFELGMREVKRLRSEMERVKEQTGFQGDLTAFFKFMNTDKQFFPYKNPQEVLDAFNQIHERMLPQLHKLFDVTPRSKFEIRQTEKFREATASAEYNQGTADGSRPGIFYVPIPDATKFNTFGMEDLFLHEAIPGHHFQNMLTIENDSLPMFRRFIWYGAYGEGWALYTESLGKELGLYTDPYQYFAALSEEMHRAIRLVVDVGMHMKGWSREEAIRFSLENEGEGEEAIVAEIERYMAIPGQALSYKIGQLRIRELRHQAETRLGNAFDIRAFHNEILDDGCLPLSVLDAKMTRWMESVQQHQAVQ